MIDLVEIGFTRKPYGKDGYLRIVVEEAYHEVLANSRAVFINLDGSKVPFLIDDFMISGGSVLIKLDEIDNPQHAGKVTGKQVFLEKELLQGVSSANSSTFWNDIVNFLLLNEQKQVLGVIKEIIELPHQTMASIQQEEKTFMIPLHEDLVLDMDHDKKSITMTLAEGIDQIN